MVQSTQNWSEFTGFSDGENDGSSHYRVNQQTQDLANFLLDISVDNTIPDIGSYCGIRRQRKNNKFCT